jgi:hypothetical protein
VKNHEKINSIEICFNRKARKENAQSAQKIRHFKIQKS